MKSLFTFLLLFLCTVLIYGQDCATSSTTTILDINQVEAQLSVGGSLWTNGVYFVPKDGPSSSIYTGSLWMGGLDSNGDLHLAGQTYPGGNQSDYWPGPLNQDGETDSNTCSNWDRFFETSSDDINSVIADFEDNNTMDDPIPASILGWPAAGNPYFFEEQGFELPNTLELAPFVDRDNDGIYDPQNGDYPLVQGDQVYWWVNNDNGNTHYTNGLPIKMEIQTTAFAYADGPATGIEYTTFYKQKLIYKGQDTLQDFYLTQWVDTDLGCYGDDRVGCIPEDNIAFTYNGDGMDICNSGYQSDIPAMAFKVLSHKAPGTQEEANMSRFMFTWNGNVVMELYQQYQTPPNFAPQYYDFMKGIWKDGTLLTEGEGGHNPFGDPVDFAFPGNPSNTSAWTECSANTPISDRSILMVFGPYTLYPGAVTNLDFAAVWLPSQGHTCPDLSGLIDASNGIKDFYEQQIVSSTREVNLYENDLVKASPNPATEKVVLEITSTANLNFQSIQFFSSDGKLVHSVDQVNSPIFSWENPMKVAGLYYYKALMDGGKLASGKIIFK